MKYRWKSSALQWSLRLWCMSRQCMLHCNQPAAYVKRPHLDQWLTAPRHYVTYTSDRVRNVESDCNCSCITGWPEDVYTQQPLIWCKLNYRDSSQALKEVLGPQSFNRLIKCEEKSKFQYSVKFIQSQKMSWYREHSGPMNERTQIYSNL